MTAHPPPEHCGVLVVRAVHASVRPRIRKERLVAGGAAFRVRRGRVLVGRGRTRLVLGRGSFAVVCRARRPAVVLRDGALRIVHSRQPVILTAEGRVGAPRSATFRVRRRRRSRLTLVGVDRGIVRAVDAQRALLGPAPSDLVLAHASAPRHDVDPFPLSPLQRPVRRSDRLPSLWADGRACSTGCRPRGAIPGWPLKPFHRQHAIRAGLNELRKGSLHEGIDIVAVNHQHVYAMQPGRVHIIARSGVDERLQVGNLIYWHLHIHVREGQSVVPYRTVLGTVFGNFFHLHLSEKEGGTFVDPLRPGGRVLAPWRDTAPPVINRPYPIGFGRVAVAAYDPPSVGFRRPFHTPVIAPAGVAWREGSGPLHFAYRGTQWEPFSLRHTIFAPGARSAGFICFYKFLVCRPDWRFLLAGGLAPRLSPGVHHLTVFAWDRAGNRAARPATVRVR